MATVLEYLGRQYRVLPTGLRIGRGTDNAIIVPDEQASRHHAIVWETQGVAYIRDQGSTNGTFVNQRRITTAVPLHPGDQIQIGRATFTVRAAGEIFSAPPPQPVIAAVAPASSRQSGSVGIVLAICGIGFVTVLVLGAAVFFSITGASPTVPAPTRIALPTSPTPGITLSPVVLPTMPALVPTQAIVPPPTPDGMKRALLAVVYIEMPMDGSSNWAISGSGSIVDTRGFILTNHHVVRDSKSGKPYNSRDLIYVAVGSDPNKPPDRIFRAQVIALDSKLDLALLKLSAQKDGSALPTSMNLTPIMVGDSDLVQINEEIRVIGFPDIGGNTVTASRGIVSGFLENRTWIKTDTEVNPGNSGGAAVNAGGEIIGIPTRVVSDRTVTGKIGYIRPINLAKEILAQIK